MTSSFDPTSATLEDAVLAMARECGFTMAAIADVRPSDHAEKVRQWIREGRHGSMRYLADDLEVRLDPRRMQTGARAAICVADRYALPKSDPIAPWKLDAKTSDWPPRGRIARYARGDDYHIWIRKRLRIFAKRLRARFPDAGFRIGCDLLPILERELAARSGLGAIGKNTMLIRPGDGSYLLLGEVLTTLPLSVERERSTVVDPCGSCTRCIDACPTKAITPYSVDASQCLSYTTIEHRDSIDERFFEATDDWLFGCDICQEVCPHNAPTRRKKAHHVHEAYRERLPSIDLLTILGWSESDRQAALVRSAIRRAELGMLKRNAIICLGNALRRRPDRAIEARLQSIAIDEREEALVRETASSVIRLLNRS